MRQTWAPEGSITLLSRLAISCWLAVERRKDFICSFRVSSWIQTWETKTISSFCNQMWRMMQVRLIIIGTWNMVHFKGNRDIVVIRLKHWSLFKTNVAEKHSLTTILDDHKRTGQVSFRGAEVSCPNIFFPLLARKSSGFAQILPDFLPEYCYLKNSRGAAAPFSPMGRTPMGMTWKLRT